MSERLFLFFMGAYTLVSLYFGLDIMIYLLSLWLLFEGISNIRLTSLSQKLINKTVPSGLTVFQTKQRFDFDAFRAWRLLVAIMLGGSFFLLHFNHVEILWFFPWFMGFAIMGAGASSVCPMLLFVKWLGFK
ncbi:hypothetical protein MNBD_GAMMA06-2124 [hydrothermal vent metagenome]|uniref:DUF2892 domain-containing protein n=1 Tax=hydrothermal vent metagenome TaxID=652676 RepID=A0A3B0WRX2_9ZZZZ